MSGAYAHLSVARHTAGTLQSLRAANINNEAVKAALQHSEYVALGAVSPDYPYLAVANKKAAEWADAMHYTHTGSLIKALIQNAQQANETDKSKITAWLMGFVSHVATDITIHPVVEARVGPYHENQEAHATCEMNQDVYIFPRLNLGDTMAVPNYLDATLKVCSVDGELDPVIEQIWAETLTDIHPSIADSNPPTPGQWHKWFIGVVDKAEESPDLPKFARHVAAHIFPLYPAADEIDRSFIDDLETPNGKQGYDQIFDRALRTTLQLMKTVTDGIYGINDHYKTEIKNWNLDTGRDENGTLTAWT